MLFDTMGERCTTACPDGRIATNLDAHGYTVLSEKKLAENQGAFGTDLHLGAKQAENYDGAISSHKKTD